MSQLQYSDTARHVFLNSLPSQAQNPLLSPRLFPSMAPCADSPRDFVPPPSYQLSQEQFDRKTSHAIQLSSSIRQPIIDEDGWPRYDPAVFEAVANSYEQSPYGSSSAGADIPRHGRQASYTGLPPSTDSMKVRSSFSFLPFYRPHIHSFSQTRSSERRRRNQQSDPDYPDRLATPPPPFSATGPSLDGPPFEEVVTMSYDAPPPDSQLRPPSLSPVTQPAPLRLASPGPSQRYPDPSTRRQTHTNPYQPHRMAPPPPNIPSRLTPSSAISRLEFDPQMAYGRNGGHSSIQGGGASSFYKQVDPLITCEVF